MKVKKAMHEGAVWLSPDTPLPKLAKMMADEDIGAIPIGENDRLIGIVTDRDIVCRAVAKGKDASKLTARDVMTKGISYCRGDQDLEVAMEVMEKQKIRRLPVIDENKRLVGMLSLGDISHAAAKDVAGRVVKGVSSHH
ncbi:MAG: CBS domain-containing protein [Rhodomicrobium sp.]